MKTLSKEETWDNRFLELCAHLSTWSEDKSRKVGCVVVGDGNSIISTGYNGLPRGIANSVEARHSRQNGYKYLWFEHAERNAIFNAARHGISVNGCKIYSNLFPCAECARAIIQSGISELITFTQPENEINFAESMGVSAQMLKESGVKVTYR